MHLKIISFVVDGVFRASMEMELSSVEYSIGSKELGSHEGLELVGGSGSKISLRGVTIPVDDDILLVVVIFVNDIILVNNIIVE
jgi:hypothetical protein